MVNVFGLEWRRVATGQGLVNPAGVQRGHFGLFRVKGAIEPGENLLVEAAEVLGGGGLEPGVKLGWNVSERQVVHG